jgi:hypothetical protein
MVQDGALAGHSSLEKSELSSWDLQARLRYTICGDFWPGFWPEARRPDGLLDSAEMVEVDGAARA